MLFNIRCHTSAPPDFKIYVNVRLIYGDMQHDYGDMQLKICSFCTLKIVLIYYVKQYMLAYFCPLHARYIMSTCNLFISICNVKKLHFNKRIHVSCRDNELAC